MLRILRQDVGDHRVVLCLQGHLIAEWAKVLQRECRILTRSGLTVVLDLSGVVFIGRSGIRVVGRLARRGIKLIGCSPLIADVLRQEGIDAGRNVGESNNGKVRRKKSALAD